MAKNKYKKKNKNKRDISEVKEKAASNKSVQPEAESDIVTDSDVDADIDVDSDVNPDADPFAEPEEEIELIYDDGSAAVKKKKKPKQKGADTYTVLLIPGDGGPVKQFTVSRALMIFLTVLLLAVIVALIYLAINPGL